MNLWLSKKITSLYTMWIGNFIGHVGEGTRFKKPLRLEGKGERRISIGDNTIFNAFCILGCWERFGQDTYEPEIRIGNKCNFGEYCQISAINKITIGNGVLTGRFVYIGDNAHGRLSLENANTPPNKRTLTTKGPVKIGNNVWIGDKVSILGGVTIGDNVIIGAGSIVTHDIPSNSIAVGIHAKVIKSLS